MRCMDGSHSTAAPGLAFRKMHGAGNDFVIVDQRQRELTLEPEAVRLIGHRRFGVGFDQLAEILPDSHATARMRFWNSDGSRSAACGNASRCIADLLMKETGQSSVTLAVDNGVLAARRRPDDGLVEVDMGAPLLDWQDVPLSHAVDTLSLPLDGAPAACSMGNPHCTFFVEDAASVDLARLGPEIEHHPLFPERTNVQFVQILGPDRARARVWERGAGETLASGSSSCAVLVNAVRRGLLERQATIILDGGELQIEWREDDGHVLMAGPTAHVFTGTLSPEFPGCEPATEIAP